MPQLPHRHFAIRRRLIDIGVTGEARRNDGLIQRHNRREAIKAAALHEGQLINKHIALRAQFASVSRLTQNPRGGIASAIAERRERDLYQCNPVKMRDQIPRVFTRFNPHSVRIGFAKECFKR
jgi:hypothetical protein